MKVRRLRKFALGLLLLPTIAPAVEFAAAITPPRFELRGDPGDVLREVLNITNLGDAPGEFLVRTADWSLDEKGGVTVHPDELQSGSCRPWTRIERHRVRLAGRDERAYRFEVHIPEDAQTGECRFAILFEQPPESADSMSMGDLNVPVVGRIALIVYVAIGDAGPELHVRSVQRIERDEQSIPGLTVENTGQAHGRLQGLMRAQSAEGRKLDLVVSSSPILPGETREIALWPVNERSERIDEVAYPLSISGEVEWRGGSRSIDETVE